MPNDQPAQSEDPASPATDDRPASPESLIHRLKALFGARTWSRESLEGALEGNEQALAEALSAKERTMLRNVLAMRDLRVEDVMVPRADIDAIEINASIGELLKQFRAAGHSRLPVFRETLDDTAGMVHIKDLMNWITSQAALSDDDRAKRRTPPANGLDLRKIALKTPLVRTDLLREVLFVPPSMPAGDLLVKMQATRIHLAVVVDEYGGTDGLASIEDLVEEIVGDIEDEHDEETAPMIVPTEDGGFIADARAPIEEIAMALGERLELGELAEEIDTLGGLVFNQAGRVPVRGELVPFGGGVEAEILDADPRRVKRVRLHVPPGGTPRSLAPASGAGRSDAA